MTIMCTCIMQAKYLFIWLVVDIMIELGISNSLCKFN